ncbi:hypothetical protein TNCV_2213891 [Trichonephila clavipes]|nr:hypothetical protein TNCV_2213891 [Trichonephila clavipes]
METYNENSAAETEGHDQEIVTGVIESRTRNPMQLKTLCVEGLMPFEIFPGLKSFSWRVAEMWRECLLRCHPRHSTAFKNYEQMQIRKCRQYTLSDQKRIKQVDILFSVRHVIMTSDELSPLVTKIAILSLGQETKTTPELPPLS